MGRIVVIGAAGLTLACSRPNPAFEPVDSVAATEDTGVGDGDGDGDTGPGDGDGDTGPGDGDGDTGPGDGDGDGDTGPGDGDGDTGPGCEPGVVDCEGDCVDLDEDLEHCGSCGSPCDLNKVCVAGDCVEAKFVFVTSKSMAGNFGGLEAAWELCIQVSGVAGLPGDYAPWIANMQLVPASEQSRVGPYVRTDRTIVAYDWEDLIDGELLAPINLDENGAAIVAYPAPSCGLAAGVWTGSTNDGLWAGDDCNSWYTAEYIGSVGDPTSTTQWSSAGLCNEDCAVELPLYCVAQ